MGATRALLISIAATLSLYYVPYVRALGRPLVLLSTLVHELGHGFTAMLLGGSFHRLMIWSDASGVAEHSGISSAFGRAFVAAGGPLGPPLVALALFWAARQDRSAHVALGVFGGLMLLVAVIWTRNVFGFGFVLALGLVLAAIAWRGSAQVAQVACAFLAVQLSLAAFARSDYLFTSVARTGAGNMPSDTAQIAQALWLPYWFWGALIAATSLLVLGAGLWLFAKSMRVPG